MIKDKTTLLNGEHGVQEILKNFRFEDAIKVRTGAVNSYGLDLTHASDITYTCENLEIVVIGGVTDFVRTGLRVALKILKKHQRNSSEIYRKAVIDLLDEGQLNYCVREASARTRVESETIRTALLDLRERLDEHRSDLMKGGSREPVAELTTSSVKQVSTFLKNKNLLESTKQLLIDAGLPDGQMALRLFILGLSRMTDSPLHVVVQGSRLIAQELFKNFSQVIPKEQLREATSISKTALTYAPYEDYWQHKTLLLHQLETALGKGSVLEEYVRQGELSRIVTEVDFKSGTRRSGERIMEAKLGLMGYTSADYLPIFSCTNVLCLPLTDTNKLRELMYENEIRSFAGLDDTDKVQHSRDTLSNIQRHIKPLRIINPYLDQVDLAPFFGGDFVQIRRFLHITELITLFHQEQLGRKKNKGVVSAEVKPEHMITTLELFRDLWLKPEEELYFRVAGTFNMIKEQLKREHPDNFRQTSFKIGDMRPKVKVPFSSFSRHVQKLNEYGKLKRVGGNNRTGYEFVVADWNDENGQVEKFNQLLDELKLLEKQN